MVLVLSEAAIERNLDLAALVDVVGDALIAQAAGEVERPDRPHFPVGVGLNGESPTGTGITMPAYVHGADRYATKLVGVHEENAARDLPTINAQIVLTDARTGIPDAFMAGTTITNARTGCIGALAARELAPEELTLGVIGAGAQARWQTRAIGTVATLDDVRIYSPSDSRTACAADLADAGVPARAVKSPGAAVSGSDMVVTATTATEPVFSHDALDPGTLVVAIGAFTAEMQELAPAVIERSETVFADVPEEVAETGDLLAADRDAGDLVPLGELVADGYERRSPEAIVTVASVGSATLDAAASATIYEAAAERDDGTVISL